MATETVFLDDFPIEFGDLVAALESRGGEASSRIYMDFTLTDSVDGTLRFLIGDSGFNAGVDRVYAAVTSWGALRMFMSTDGRDRESATEIRMSSDAVVAPTNGFKVYTVHEIVRDMPLSDVKVNFIQWSEGDPGQQVIWSGYLRGIGQMVNDGDVASVSVRISNFPSTVASSIISDVIKAAPAPSDSFGKMVPRAYGSFRTGIRSTDLNSSNPAVFLGYGSRFVEGVIIDQNQSSLQLKVRFSKNDGITGWEAFQEGVADLVHSRGDIFVWISSINGYALVDPSSTVITNDGSETTVLIEGSPLVYVALRPGTVGERMSQAQGTGFLPDAYKPLDDDPSNYLETTTSNYFISYNIPDCSIPGFQPEKINLVWHVKGNGTFSGTRDYRIGIWNLRSATAPTFYLNNKFDERLGFTNGLETTIQGPSGAYVASDFTDNDGADTIAEFAQGRFISRDPSNNEVPLQAFFQVTSASKDGIRFVDMGIVVKGRLPLLGSVRRTRATRAPVKLYDPQGRPRKNPRGGILTGGEIIPGDPGFDASPSSYKFLACGKAQSDVDGTYDTAGEEIRNAVGIAHHLIAKVGGQPVNVGAGTLGNFSDAKAEAVAGEKNLDPVFGPDSQITLDEAKNMLQARYPIRLHQEQGVWQCFMDEINPHQSRYYRSSSDVVRISARLHIVSGSLSATQIPFEDIFNLVTLNYGQAYGSGRPLRSYEYSNFLSQRLFGIKPRRKPFDEPWLTVDSLDLDTEAAKFLARHAGQVSARPRLTVNVKLSEEFFDLRVGHVVEFDVDMESVGIQCPAYRCGRLDYAYQRGGALSGTDQSDDKTPNLMPGGSVTSETYFLTSQQIDGLTFGIPGGGAYTTVANGWEYYNGTAFAALSNVVRSDGGDPLAVFKASAGTYKVNWDRPAPHLVKKAEFAVNALVFDAVGPCYIYRMKYATSTVAVVGTALTTYDAKWYGRQFEVVEVTRKPGSIGSYPYVDVVLMEVM